MVGRGMEAKGEGREVQHHEIPRPRPHGCLDQIKPPNTEKLPRPRRAGRTPRGRGLSPTLMSRTLAAHPRVLRTGPSPARRKR